MNKYLIYLFNCILVTGCASTPDVELNYYHPKSTAKVTLMQSVTCTTDYKALAEASTLMVDVTHSADTSKAFTIPLKEFDSEFKDANLQFGFRPDGRLMSINTSVTGRGQETLESIASVIGSLAGLNLGGGGEFTPSFDGSPATRINTICKTINLGNSKKDSVANFVYEADLNLSDLLAGGKPLTATSATQLLNTRIAKDLVAAGQSGTPLITEVTVISTEIAEVANNFRVLPSSYKNADTKAEKVALLTYENDNSVFPLELLSTRKFKINASRKFPETQDNLPSGSIKPSVSISVAGEPKASPSELNQTYYVPIPKGSFFGTAGFVLALDDDGSITTLSYSNVTGTASALNSLNSGLENFQESSDTEIANMIAAQSRRLRCEADPVSCT